MYINNMMCSYGAKPTESKCSRIFRPWDSASETQDNSQDSTISTTTNDSEGNRISLETPKEKNNEIYSDKKEGFRPIHKSEKKVTETRISQQRVPSNYHLDYTLYPDMLQTNLAQSLGINSNDSLFMDSMVQGFALEEYARVLNQEHQAKVLASKKQRPKKYKCPHCDVGFSNNGQLKGHIRIHTGERPFKCDEKDCGKTFTRNEELTRHKRIHSGLRPFPCTHCGKRFGRKDHLKKHSRTHFQPRGLYAVPVMLPFETWASSSGSYPFVPMFGY